MPDLDGLGPLLRGLVACGAFLLLFAGARARFTDQERRRGPADVGLD